jgi:large subunit ribosomal protein L34
MSLSTVGSSFARRGYPILHSLKRLHQPTQIMSPHVRHYSLEIQPAFPLFRIDQSLPSLWNEFTLLIKRTFQPSVIRKRRKTGFLKRHKSVGGRRVLDRRAQKGRIRLGGC